MNVLKTFLLVTAATTILFVVRCSSSKESETVSDDDLQTGNTFVIDINQKIKTLRELPENTSLIAAKKNYEYTKERIDHLSNLKTTIYPHGGFGSTKQENDRRRATLTKNLDAAYDAKFIELAFFVFNGKEWKRSDLDFIRSKHEKRLKSSLDTNVAKIPVILNKHKQIDDFIKNSNNLSFKISDTSGCFPFKDIDDLIKNNYSPGYSSSDSPDCFPITDARGKINRMREYSRNNLENEHVNNCADLHNRLRGIEQKLFNRHIDYLGQKIGYWSNKFPQFMSEEYRVYMREEHPRIDYLKILFEPLKKEIENFKSYYPNTYDVKNFNRKIDSLRNIWDAESEKSRNYNPSEQ